MKVAIGISGIYRKNLLFDPIESIENIKKKFNADVYFHTWENKEDQIPSRFKKKGFFFTSPEPEINYHPLFDPAPTSNPKLLFYRKTKLNKEINQFSNKQIIGYSNLFDKIPKKYDIYIRTRWDVMINPKFNFQKYFKFVDKGPVGFMIREVGPNYYPLNKVEGKIVPKKKSKVNFNDWHEMLSDYLIMHKESNINTKNVYALHESQQLLGSEWGWWQVLSKPYGGDNHTCIYGGVILVRDKRKFIIDKNFRLRRIFIK